MCEERPFILVIDPEEQWVRQLESAYPQYRFRWFEDGEIGLKAVLTYGSWARVSLGSSNTFVSAVYLVIVSAELPKIKGLKVVDSIHRLLPNLPVVLGSLNPKLSDKALQKGACAFVQKPFKATQFRSILAQLNHVEKRVG